MAYHNGPKPVNDGLVLCLDAGNRKSQTNNRFRSYGTGLTTENVGFAVNGTGTFQRVAAGTVIGGYTVQTSDVVYSYALGSDGCHYHGSTSIIPAGSYATMAVDYLVTGATNYPSNGALLVFENYGGSALGGVAYVPNNLQNVWQRLTLTNGPTAGIGTQAMFLYPGYCGGRMADSGTIYMRNPIVEWKSADSGPAGFNATSDLTQWYDLSGNGYNGTLTNGPIYDSGNSGSIIFDGTNDVVSITNSGQFSFKGLPFTVSMWINPTVWTNSSDARTLIDFESDGWIGWLIRQVGSYTFLTGNNDQQISATLPATGTWTNVCFTSDSISGFMYFNGVLNYTTAALTYPSNSTTSAYGIGSNVENTGQGFSGKIATVNVYNRMLSAAQVLQNYNATKGRFGL
jgi:hypothetical protein